MPSTLKDYPNKTTLTRLGDLEILLNLLTDPAVVVEKPDGAISISNKLFSKLCGFSEDEITTLSFDKLFAGVRIEQLVPGEVITAVLKRRNKTVLPVTFLVNNLDASTESLLLLITSSEFGRGLTYSQNNSGKILEPLLDLITCLDDSDLLCSIKRILDTSEAIFTTKLICLYQSKIGSREVQKVLTCEPLRVYPDVIPSSDLLRLMGNQFWTPGILASTEIYKAARLAELKFVASIHLNLGESGSGLLVIGGAEPAPQENILSLMEFLGNFITSRWHQFTTNQNLQNHILGIENELVIQQELINTVQQGIIILEPDFTIKSINPAAEVMLGYADREVGGQYIENVLIGPDGLLRALENARGGIPTHNVGQVQIHRRNGQSFPAQLAILPVESSNQILAMLIIITDVSLDEQTRLRTQQLEHRAVLGEFTAIFAHEVRNPINNISTGLQLLSSHLSNEDPNQEIINRMLGDCNRLNHLMESVLSFSRPLETKFEPLDIVFLLQRILDRWRPRLARVNVEFFFQPLSDLPKVIGDIRSLEQVFINLISNAVEAMSKAGGILGVHIKKFDEIPNTPQIEVTISDTGPGIPDEIRDRIFEPFVSNNPRGTGLGLAISKRIVTAHHGSIRVESFPGGTVFHVYLPAAIGVTNELNNSDR